MLFDVSLECIKLFDVVIFLGSPFLSALGEHVGWVLCGGVADSVRGGEEYEGQKHFLQIPYLCMLCVYCVSCV